MRKLLKELQTWYNRNKGFHDLTKWQREVLYEFITEQIKAIDKSNKGVKKE